ncbi:MAG: glycosyltransferase family 2 protein [Crenarchaeota archaeon]|nr:glycosyltransferase family 2 protein [Thermoproteota archaeon]
MENQINFPTLSFILVNWNTKDLTLQCIKSIYDDCCSVLAFEIIVTDNASNDGSADAIESEFPSVKVIRNKENSGFAKGNNIAIREAKGEFVVLVNTDVVIIPGCMKTLYTYMVNNSLAGMVVPQVLNEDGTIQCTLKKEVTLLRTLFRIFWIDSIIPYLQTYSYKKLEEVEVAGGCFFMIRKTALEQTGVLDEKFYFYGEDRDYCKRLRSNNWKIMFIPDARIYHFSAKSSKGNPVKYELLLEVAYLQYWKKHFSSSFQLYHSLKIAQHFIRLCVNFTLYCISPKSKSSARFKSNYEKNWNVLLLLFKKIEMLPKEYTSLFVKQYCDLFGK